jgi:hypothetical protein
MPRASSLRAWFRDVEEERPKRLARPCRTVLPPRLPVSRPSARRRWQNGPFDHGITAALRSRALRPRRDSAAWRSLRSARSGRDPSIEGVQPSCQRSAPGIRIDAPSRSPGGCRGSRRFTRFDPRCARRSGVLCRSGVCPTSLWRSWSLCGAGLAATTTAESPRRLLDPPRERRARACGQGAPSADEGRPKALPLVRCRTSRRVCSPIGRSRSARCLRTSTATTARFLRTPDTARRLLPSTRNPSTPAW